MSDFGTISNLRTIPTPADDGSFAKRRARNWQETIAARTSGQSEPKLEMLGEILPPTAGQTELRSMNFRELDQAIDGELCRVRDRLIPYLVRMRELLSDQGQRTDLPSDIPKKLTWQSWIESKKGILGSISTVNRMLREAYDEERQKNACAECGKTKGHKTTCSRYVPPDPEPLTALEKKFVGSALLQHEALKDYYAGRTDADAALKALVATIPTHQALEEYTSGSAAGIEDEAEANEKPGSQEGCIAELRLEIARLNAENGALQQRLTELTKVAKHLRDETINGDLAAEPDTVVASGILTQGLQTVANEYGSDRIKIKEVRATVEFAGRDYRIMPADFLEKRDNNTAPTLCKCTGITDSAETKVSEWDGTLSQWGSERAITDEEENSYRVINEARARKIDPEAVAPNAETKKKLDALETTNAVRGKTSSEIKQLIASPKAHSYDLVALRVALSAKLSTEAEAPR